MGKNSKYAFLNSFLEKHSQMRFKELGRLIHKTFSESHGIKLKDAENCVYHFRKNSKKEIVQVIPLVETSTENCNVLVIADLHEPFSMDGYLQHCLNVKEKFNCTKIVFSGDVIDNHYSSFHPTDPDGFSAGEELKRAKKRLKRWYKAFPEAIVLNGNHDNIFKRQAFSNGLSTDVIKDLKDILETPNWKFVDNYTFQNVYYHHGFNSVNQNIEMVLRTGLSCVQGHLHTKSLIEYVTQNCFSMVVGCGIDSKKYAFGYAKHNVKPAIVSCSVIVDGIPQVIPMKF